MATRKCIDLTWKTGEIINLPRGNGWTPQSLAYKDISHRYVICNNMANKNAKNNICTVGEVGYSMATGKFFAGHANGSCYCHKNGLVYVLHARTQVYAYDPKTWDRKFIVKLDGLSIAGLAYDRVTNQFYGASTRKICVFSYTGFSHGGTCKQHKTFNKTFIPSSGYHQQDCSGHNGVIMCCHSKQHKRSAGIYAYIDCYNAKDGKYIRTYRTTGECESVAVEESTNRLHVLYAQDRQLIRCTTVFALKGEPHIFKGDTSTIGISTVSESDLRNKIVKKAKSYKGDKGNHFWEVYGMTADWCAMFVWTIFKECGMSDIINKTAYVPTMRDWLKDHGFTRTVKTAKPGDIAIFGGGNHVEIVAGKDSSGRLLTIGGNTGYSEGATSFRNSTVSSSRYYGSTPTAIFSPKYSSSTAYASTITIEVENKNLEISVDKLYSSDNFEYLQSDQEKQRNEAINSVNAQLARIQQLQLNATSVIPDTVQNVNILLSGINLSDTKQTKTKINSEAHGPSLPVALNPIETPFVQLTIGGYEFGAKSTDDTNYINGLSVVRTNGSMNEYTINLVHQVSPGRNPNFIDELLASNSYEKIKIRYGDAMSNVIFEDNSALLIGASVSFDFVGYCINYELKATSSVISTATHKLSYPTKTDKGSNIIRDLLADASTGLGDIYPNMKNANYISKNNLIPQNDKVITVEAVSNVNPLNYLKTVVATMQSATSDTSNYYLVLGDNDFKIYEINSLNLSYDASLYEVNINYPDDNQTFSFNCNTDFAWPLAYDFNGNISTYNYTLDHNGMIDTSYSRNPNLLDFASSQQTDISNNWWKNVTEFPITGTLECRGLLSPLLLMTYIKVNCLYYGQQRLTSGVYIVTGQQDILTGSGYRTILSLLRVAGPKQQLTIDGRVRT